MASNTITASQTFYGIAQDERSVNSQHVTLISNSLPITLRTPRAVDIPGLTEVMADPRNTASDGAVANMSPADLKDLVSKWTQLSSPLTHLTLAVLLEGKVVGISGFGLVRSARDQGLSDDPNDLCGVVGVMINPEVRGRGIAREAVRISIDYGLRELGFRRVTLGTSSQNVAMRKLMERGLGIPAVVMDEPDKFGNDLVWRIDPQDWLTREET